MTLLEALQLIGYSLGAVLPLWMGYLLLKQRLGMVPIQRLLLSLGWCMAGWHASNLVITLHSLLGLDVARWSGVLRAANSIAVISITVCYSLLLHVHIHLWAGARSRPLTRTERVRIYLSYIPCLFLIVTVPRLWMGRYQPMIAKLSQFVLPFAFWVVYSLAIVAITELLVAQRAPSKSERRILRTLAGSFIAIAILILALTLLAAPLRGWLEKRFRALFERETALYREVVTHVGSHAGRYRRLPELLAFIESQTASALSLRRVKIVLLPSNDDGMSPDKSDESAWIENVLSRARAAGVTAFEDDVAFGEHKYSIAYVLRREDRDAGLLLIESSPNALTPEVRAVLEVLAGQVAIAIEDCRLAEENLRLERKVAEGERLAALGQMAATVAHEVKNPLSAIKSIAQVMSEDEALKSQHARDLSLIVGETDRLSKSLTQLLSFASKQPPASPPCRADELLRSVNSLFRLEAGEKNITLEYRATTPLRLDGVQTAAVRDALSNLVLNALQSTPGGGTVTIESFVDKNEIVFAVSDSGPGIAAELRARIWEPFFTTRQRGTGLGLAIVRKRVEEAGGTARLVSSKNGKGSRFEVRLPVAQVVNLRPR